jgi:lipoate-protein ligase B
VAKTLQVRRLGRVPYREAFALQEALVAAHHAGEGVDTLLLLEHPPVITLGRDAKRDNVKYPEAFLNERGIELVDTDRGGDATFHGPGQLVAYPILDLKPDFCDIRRFVNGLERVMIDTVAEYGLTAGPPGAGARRGAGAGGGCLEGPRGGRGGRGSRLPGRQVAAPCGAATCSCASTPSSISTGTSTVKCRPL